MSWIEKSCLVIGLAVLILGASPTQAQSVPGLSRPTTESAPAPRPTPAPDAFLEISDIHSRALLLQTRLRSIRSEARPRETVVRVEQELQDMFWGAYYGSCIDRFGVQWMFNCAEQQHG